MMRLHALQCMHEEASPLKIYISIFRNDDPFNITSRPECVSHRPPRVLWIRTKVTLPIIADLEPGGGARYCEIDYASIIRR